MAGSSAVEGGRGLLPGLSCRGGSRPGSGAVVAGDMEGGPPENNLKEGCVCCHDGFARCCKSIGRWLQLLMRVFNAHSR